VILSVTAFSGETPRLPADRLPGEGAQLAINCDLTAGELRPLRAPLDLLTADASARPVRSIFTDDGLRYFCWNTPTRAMLSPTIDDTASRVYFLSHGSHLRVTQTSNMKAISANPGAPTVSYKVGVPAPTQLLASQSVASTDAPRTVVSATAGEDGGPCLQMTEATVSTTAKYSVGATAAGTINIGFRANANRNVTISVGLDQYNAAGEMVASSTVDKVITTSYGTHTVTFTAPMRADRNEIVFIVKANTSANNVVRLANCIVTEEELAASPVPVFRSSAAPTVTTAGTIWVDPNNKVTTTNGVSVTTYGPFVKVRQGNAWVEASTITGKTYNIDTNMTVGTTYVWSKNSSKISDIAGKEDGNKMSDPKFLGSPIGAIVGTTITSKSTVVVVATCVNIWGEESYPCAPMTIEAEKDNAMSYSVTIPAFTDHVPLAGINIYRTYAGQKNTAYFLQNPTPYTATAGSVLTVRDGTSEPPTASTLKSLEWDNPPPLPANLTFLGNGILAMSQGKDLIMCEPYRPHAWPYRMTFPSGIIGITATEGGALVTTQLLPYRVSGAHPTNMAQTPIPAEQAGISDTAMVSVQGAAVFASNDGFVAVDRGNANTEASQRLFSRKAWRDLYGSRLRNLRLAQYDGAMFGLIDPTYPSAATSGMFMVQMDSGWTYSRVDTGTTAYSALNAQITDQLMLGTATGVSIFAGADNTNMSYTWHSRDFIYPNAITFAAGVVDCIGTCQIEIFADGLSLGVQDVSGFTTLRVDATDRARVWSFKLTGTGIVRSVAIANSFAELGL
jgi:hypothetical protein